VNYWKKTDREAVERSSGDEPFERIIVVASNRLAIHAALAVILIGLLAIGFGM
jgi:hypothetical protein